jgi:hypothetical protein
VLGKLKSSAYRLVRQASADATNERIASEVGESKRLLAEYIDARVTPMAQAVERIDAYADRNDAARIAELQRESLSYVAQELRHVHEALDRAAPPGIRALITEIADGDAHNLDAEHAALINVSAAHTGPLSTAGLYLNPPVQTEWRPGGVRLSNVNERIAELPFVVRGLAGLPVGARVLDIGCAESTLSLTLATLGFDVTALDPRGYPFSHPGLTVLRQRIDQLRPEDHEPFDAVVSLSAVEHFGLAAYEGDVRADDADRLTLDLAAELLVPDGRFVITAPYGRPHVTALERIYGPDEFASLLTGWEVRERLVLHRADDLTWLPGEDLDAQGCVLAVAVRSSSA